MKKNKHIPLLSTKEKIDKSISDMKDFKLVVEEKFVGEMWSNVSGKLEPISNSIQALREKFAAQNSSMKNNSDIKPK